jgi:hypothetical protein
MAPHLRLGSSVLALLLAAPALGQDRAVTYNLYGTPGLLEMPSALSADEGEIAGTLSYFGGQTRATFTFQATDRFSGSFRYAGIEDYLDKPEGSDPDNFTIYDRSFDLRYRFTDEGPVMPMIAVGLQDFLGTGLYAAEYIVATKTLGSAVRVTAGLGWGRLGTHNGFDNPLGLGERPGREGGDQGGVPGVRDFFRGDAALFGGVEWAPSERWILKAEYSSDDAYEDVLGNPLFERRSPLNFGVTWRPRPGVQLGLGYLYGSQLAFGATILINPNDPPFGAGLDPAPQPVAVRAEAVRAARSWDRAALPEAALRQRLAEALRTEGVELAAVELTDGPRACATPTRASAARRRPWAASCAS